MNVRRRRQPLSDVIVRYLAWLCLLLALWPTFVSAAATAAVPVVTNIAGAVQLRSSNGSSRDILSSQIMRNGDMLVTGVDSLAVVQLADVGRIRLGPGTRTTATSSGSALSFNIASGSMCIESQRPAINIQAGALAISAAADGTIFNLMRNASGTKLAVYQGQVSTKVSGKSSLTIKTGEAFASGRDGVPQTVPIQTLTSTFLALHCPDEAIIAQAMATPGPPPAVSSGGGGGGGGIIGILLGLAGLAALAGGHGGGGGGGNPQPSPSIGPSPSPSPGALMVNPSSLSFSALGGSHNQNFSATEAHYGGIISAVSDNPDVATVNPASGSGSMTFTVTPVAQGTAHITVTDNHSGSQTVTISVQLAPGPLSASPSSLLFTALGASHSQQFMGSETNYSGPINASSDATDVATVSPASGSGPSVTFTVTPVGAGTAHISVTDNHGGSTTVTVNVAPPGALTVAPGSLTFTSVGAGSQPFAASETGYSGSIFTSGCSGVAIITPGTGSGPSQTFTVSPQAGGTCTITVTDDHGGTQSVSITVFGALTVAPASLTFNGTSTAQNLTVSETAYSGVFTTSGCTGIVTITPSTGNGPSSTLSVQPVSSGTCNITVSDDHGNAKNVFVTVNAGTLSASPSSLTFTSSTAASQQFTASENNFTGALTVTGCPGVVSVSPNPGAGPSQIFTVSPTGEGSCNLTVSDVPGPNTATVAITVFGPISLSPNSLSFNGTTASQTLTAQEDFYAGPFTIHDPTCSGVVTVTGGGNGPTQNYTVTPIAAGSCSVTVRDDHGGNDTSTITVSAGTLGVVPGTLTFNNTTASQNVTATENNYTGPFTVSGCGGIVSVTPASGTGPSQVFSVTPGSTAGNCAITVSDNHGQSAKVTVFVTTGSMTVDKSQLQFASSGDAPQSFTATSPGAATITVTTLPNATVATVSPTSGAGSPVIFTVTPTGNGRTSLTVDDGMGGQAVVSIGVGMTPLVNKRHPISAAPAPTSAPKQQPPRERQLPLTGQHPPQPMSPSANSPFGSQNGASGTHLPYGALTTGVLTLLFRNSIAPQSLTVFELNYAGLFNAASSNPNVVTVSGLASRGPNAWFTITPHNPGIAIIHIVDDHGGIRDVFVTVQPPEIIKPLPGRRPNLPGHPPTNP